MYEDLLHSRRFTEDADPCPHGGVLEPVDFEGKSKIDEGGAKSVVYTILMGIMWITILGLLGLKNSETPSKLNLNWLFSTIKQCCLLACPVS